MTYEQNTESSSAKEVETPRDALTIEREAHDRLREKYHEALERGLEQAILLTEARAELAGLKERRRWTTTDLYLMLYGVAVLLIVLGTVVLPAVTR